MNEHELEQNELIKQRIEKVEDLKKKFYPFSSRHLVMRERQSNFVLSF